MAASKAQHMFEDIAAKAKKAFSEDEMLRSRNDDDSRLDALSAQLGLSAVEVQELRATQRHAPGSRKHSYDQQGEERASPPLVRNDSNAGRLRTMTSPDLRAARNQEEKAAAEARAAELRVDRGSASDVQGDEEGITSVPVRKFQSLSTKEKIWAIMDDPTSSRAAQIVAAVIMLMIIVSCVAFVVQTLPEYVNSEGSAPWAAVEDACIAVFTLEFVLRAASTPDRLSFIKKPMNIIDLLAILPFYLELMIGASSSGSQVIRLVRLVRIFRIFKISRYLPWVRVFTNALSLSLQPLIMLVLVVMIAMVLFSSVIYYAERGEWSEARQAWMRSQLDGSQVVSPYQSIPVSFWWCIVTMTTVGYGDMYPVTTAGRFIAALASLSGILVVAIPVSVISTNFNGEYAKLLRQREQVKARMLLLRKQFRESKTGLEAVLDEIEDIVTRNTQELQSEISTLFDQARAELTEEMCEILRMAYERRRLLHLAALAAGRLQAKGAGGDDAGTAAIESHLSMSGPHEFASPALAGVMGSGDGGFGTSSSVPASPAGFGRPGSAAASPTLSGAGGAGGDRGRQGRAGSSVAVGAGRGSALATISELELPPMASSTASSGTGGGSSRQVLSPVAASALAAAAAHAAGAPVPQAPIPAGPRVPAPRPRMHAAASSSSEESGAAALEGGGGGASGSGSGLGAGGLAVVAEEESGGEVTPVTPMPMPVAQASAIDAPVSAGSAAAAAVAAVAAVGEEAVAGAVAVGGEAEFTVAWGTQEGEAQVVGGEANPFDVDFGEESAQVAGVSSGILPTAAAPATPEAPEAAAGTGGTGEEAQPLEAAAWPGAGKAEDPFGF